MVVYMEPMCTQLKETTGGEFGVYRASIRFYKVYGPPITATTHLKMS